METVCKKIFYSDLIGKLLENKLLTDSDVNDGFILDICRAFKIVTIEGITPSRIGKSQLENLKDIAIKFRLHRSNLILLKKDSIEKTTEELNKYKDLKAELEKNENLSDEDKLKLDLVNKTIESNKKKIRNAEEKIKLIESYIPKVGLVIQRANKLIKELPPVDSEKDKPEPESTDNTTDKNNLPSRKNSLSLNSALDLIFRTTPGPKALCRRLFKTAVFEMTVVDRRSGIIIKDNETLNQAIIKQKNLFYKTIYNYLKKIDKNLDIPEVMFDNAGNLSENWSNVMKLFEAMLPITNQDNYINGIWNPNTEEVIEFLKKIRYGYSDYLSKKQDTDDCKFFLVLSAYMNLKYFDSLLKDEVGKVINIDPEIGMNNEVSNVLWKYSFSLRMNSLAKGWNTGEHTDGLEEAGRFSRLIIDNIGYYNFDTKKRQSFNLDTTLFATAITNLFAASVEAQSFGITGGETSILEYVKKFHNSSNVYLKLMLESLFSKYKNKGIGNLRNTLKNHGLSDIDLNVLYSLYKFLYASDDEYQSLELCEYNTFFKDDSESFTQGDYPIRECLLGFIDRLMQASYLETRTDSIGNIQIRIKKKFSVRNEEVQKRIFINEFVKSSSVSRAEFLDKYKFENQNGNFHFKIGSRSFVLSTRSDKKNIFEANNSAVQLQEVFIEDGEIKLKPTKIKLLFSNKDIDDLLSKNSKNELKGVLQFILASLGLKLDSRESLETLLIALSKDSKIILEIFKSAARAGAVHKLYYDYESSDEYESLYSYVSEILPELKGDERHLKKNIWDRSRNEEEPEMNAIRFYDTWIDTLVYAEATISGSTAKSTTKDMFGKNIGNFSTSFLGGNILYYLNLAKYKYNPRTRKEDLRENSVLRNLLFSMKPELISGIVINLDSQAKNGTKKVVKKMNTNELLHLAIFNNFYGSYILNGTYIIQPTTYSDKTKIIEYIINTNQTVGNLIGVNSTKKLDELSSSELIDLFVKTIGTSYKQTFKNTLSKYVDIFGITLSDFNADIEAEYYTYLSKFEDPSLGNENDFIKNLLDLNKLLQVVLNKIKQLNEDETKKNKEEWLSTEAHKKGVTVFLDSDYRVDKGKIYFNELLDYYANFLFTDKDNLTERLREESINFVNDIINSNLVFYLHYSDGSDTIIQLVIESIFPNESYNLEKHKSPLFEGLNLQEGDKILKAFMDKWVIGDKLILARSGSTPYIYGTQVPNDESVEINPLLERYFYTDTLLANNLRLSLTGTELAHPAKYIDRIDINEDIEETTKDENGVESVARVNRFTDSNKFFRINKPIYKVLESTLQMAQLKRNVIIPATLLYMTQGTLRGIPRLNNIAVFRDSKAKVFTYLGESKSIDGNDGSGRCNCLISIIENNSLLDQRVGGVKKTIMHAPIYGTGGVVLGKWAIFDINNEGMRSGLNNDIEDYELNKSMLNKMWYLFEGGSEESRYLNTEFIDVERMRDDNGKIREIDLTKVRGISGTRGIDFLRDILKGKSLFREIIEEIKEADPYTGRKITKIQKAIKQINGFGKTRLGETNLYVYYTEENTMDGTMPLNDSREIYHIFDENSNHLELNEDLLDLLLSKITVSADGHYFTLNEKVTLGNETFAAGRRFHTINSNFELVESLGGINSVELSENNTYIPSESSNYAAVEFINALCYISNIDKDNKTSYLDSDMYYQPLKDCMIHYSVNNTSIKNGTGNINLEGAWRRPEGMTFMRVGYDGIGIQLDSDHEVDESLLTEFSLVIASLDALGNVHNLARNVFDNLSKIARSAAITEIDALEKFLRETFNLNDPAEKLVSDIYDVVGRICINNFKNKHGEGNCADEILDAVKLQFNKNINHLTDSYKIPFSDPGVFNSILPTFVSRINDKAIKRKYPGSGSVQCPSYGMRQIYEIEGHKYQARDIFEEIFNYEYKDELKRTHRLIKEGEYSKRFGESDTAWRKRIIRKYLENKLKALINKSINENNTGRDLFHPTENVLIRIPRRNPISNKELDLYRTFYVSLDDPSDYYIFTQNYWTELLKDESGKSLSEKELRELSLEGAQFFKDITHPRNLAPAKTTWEEEVYEYNANGVLQRVGFRKRNVFMEEAVQKGFTSIARYKTLNPLTLEEIEKEITIPNSWAKDDNLKDKIKRITGEDVTSVISIQGNKSKNSEILDLFRSIKSGQIIRYVYNPFTNLYEEIGCRIRNLEDKSSEIIMSSLYLSKYEDHTSLPKVLKDKSLISIKPKVLLSGSQLYHLTLAKHTGKHSFITFNDVDTDDKNIEEVNWERYKLIRKTVKQKKDGEVIDREVIMLYSIDKDSVLLYPIGYCELKEGYTFADDGSIRDENNVEVKTDKKVNYIKGLNGEVYKINIFVNKYKVTHLTPLRNGKTRETKHLLYHIDLDLLKHFFGEDSEDDYLGRAREVLSYLYESEEADEIRANLRSSFWDSSKITRDLLSELIAKTTFLDQTINKDKTELSKLIITSDSDNEVWSKEDYEKLQLFKEFLNNTLTFEIILEIRKDPLKIQMAINLIISNYKGTHYLLDENIVKELFSKVRTENTIDEWKEKVLDNLKDVLRDERMFKFVRKHYNSRNAAVVSSFERSLKMICSRIPAQSLQSFMECEVVGFLESKNNYVYVSHWQLYLQGSDYDIDKSYIMGSEIDRSGIYVGWSPLFRYDTYESLRASEKLPYPDRSIFIKINDPEASLGKTLNALLILDQYTKVQNDPVKVTEFFVELLDLIGRKKYTNFAYDENKLISNVIEILKSKDPKLIRNLFSHKYIARLFGLFDEKYNISKEKLDAKVLEVLTKINETEDITTLEEVQKILEYKIKQIRYVVNSINLHNLYTPSTERMEAATRNSISSKIGMIVLDLENRVHAYTPITMDDIRPDESKKAPITLLNPATKLIMLVLNMVGKDVIGISAVGMKIFYNLTFYWNELVKLNNVKYLTFYKVFNRIQNRYNESRNNTLLSLIKNIRKRSKEEIKQIIRDSITDSDLRGNSLYTDLETDLTLLEAYIDLRLDKKPKEEEKKEEGEKKEESKSDKKQTLAEKLADYREKYKDDLEKLKALDDIEKLIPEYERIKELRKERRKKILEEKLADDVKLYNIDLSDYNEYKKYQERKKKAKEEKKKFTEKEPRKITKKPVDPRKKFVPKETYYNDPELDEILKRMSKVYRTILDKFNRIDGKTIGASTLSVRERLDAIQELTLTEDERNLLNLLKSKSTLTKEEELLVKELEEKDKLTEEELIQLNNLEEYYSKLFRNTVIRKSKFIRTNILKILVEYLRTTTLDDTYKLQLVTGEASLDQIYNDIELQIKSGLEVEKEAKQLYIALSVKNIYEHEKREITALRLANGGLRSRSIDKLANVNFAVENIRDLQNSFKHIKEIIKQVDNEFKLNPRISITDTSLETGYRDEEILITDEAFKTKEVLRRLKEELDNTEKVDLFISLLLSAATDNAKELILALINAGSDLAGYYLYLLSLGFNIKDIISFMTSPIILSVHDLAQVNMFSDITPLLNVDNIIDILSGKRLDLILSRDNQDKLFGRIGSGETAFLDYIEKRIDGSDNTPLYRIIGDNQADFLEIVILTIKRNIQSLGQEFSDYLEDLKELQNLKSLVREHSDLGNVFLGMNQGLPVSEDDLLKKLAAITNTVKNREKEFGLLYLIKLINKDLENEDISIKEIQDLILKEKEERIENKDIDILYDDEFDEETIPEDDIRRLIRNYIDLIMETNSFKEKVNQLYENNPTISKEMISLILIKTMLTRYKDGHTLFNLFNVREWVLNPIYLKRIREYYNIIKGTWNIFDVAYKLPHYNTILRLFRTIYGINNALSLKARLIDIIHLRLLNEGRFLDDDDLTLILNYVDDRLIYNYFEKKLNNLIIVIPPGVGYMNSERIVKINQGYKSIQLGSVDGIANFKRLMEEYIIPHLKTGDLEDIEVNEDGITNKITGKIIDTSFGGEANYFITSLSKFINNNEIQGYKIEGLDLMNIDKSDDSLLKYQMILESFTRLKDINFMGKSLADWFILYNLVLNKNKFGSDRLTGIFRNFVLNVREDNIYREYYDFIGSADYLVRTDDLMKDFNIDMSDLELYLAKLIPPSLESSSNYKYIKLYVNGKLVYKYRIGYGKYAELPIGISKLLETSINEKKLREASNNTKQFYLRLNPSLENRSYFINLLESNDSFDVLKGLVMLELNEIVRINIKC